MNAIIISSSAYTSIAHTGSGIKELTRVSSSSASLARRVINRCCLKHVKTRLAKGVFAWMVNILRIQAAVDWILGTHFVLSRSKGGVVAAFSRARRGPWWCFLQIVRCKVGLVIDRQIVLWVAVQALFFHWLRWFSLRIKVLTWSSETGEWRKQRIQSTLNW